MRGGDTAGLRAYNERLIVNAIRQYGPMSKAELGRKTGLSGQAASVIVNALLEDGTLIKGEKIRGQVGQPSTPIALNPDGAFTLGIKIGRRSVEVILVNLLGELTERSHESYRAPYPEQTLSLVAKSAAELIQLIPRPIETKLAGIGVALPGDLHEWAAELGLAQNALQGWAELDVAAQLESRIGYPVKLYNDATAACAAEMIMGDTMTEKSAFYFYIGTFIGGGVVLNGRLYRGEQLNAAALGSMPMEGLTKDGRPRQLIHCASVIDLIHELEKIGLDAHAVTDPVDSMDAETAFEKWLDTAAPALARATMCTLSIIDFQSIVVDGLLHPVWRRRLIERLSTLFDSYNRSGLSPITIKQGSIGPKARVMGAALLPLNARFAPDTDLLVSPGD